MQLQEIMTVGVETVATTDTVRHAARLMAEMNIGFLVVTQDRKPVGVVTDRDIVVRIVAEGLESDTPIQRAMTPMTQTVDGTMSVEEAAQLMKEKQIRRLLIAGSDGSLAGVVSLGDLACDGEDELLAGDALEGISEPAAPVRLKG